MGFSIRFLLATSVALTLLVGQGYILPASLHAGEQAVRALASVKRLIAEGRISRDAVLRIVVKQGNINNFWGRDFALKNEWERQTGIRLDVSTRPQKPVLDFLRKKDEKVDLTVARQREYPDLWSEGLIADLTPLLQRHGFSLDHDSQDGFYLLASQSEFDGRIVAIPADGDIAILYLRRDLLESPLHKSRFLKEFGRPLSVPATWAEYQSLVEFFTDPAEGLFGSCEEREPHTGWMFWMPRYVSQSLPNQWLFDADMHPLIDSPQGVAATQSYIATVPYSPPDILEEGNNYSYVVPIFREGGCFSAILTLAGAKIYQGHGSAVRDRFIAAPLPGTAVGDRLVSRSSFIYGNNLVVPSSSEQKELALLYALWLTDPDISMRSVLVQSGFADPYRHNHLRDKKTRAIYTRQALDTLATELNRTIPAGTGLPGDAEYIDALNYNLWLAARGEITPAQAMKRTAEAWEGITERFGRASQIGYWRSFREKFPAAEESRPPEFR